MLFVEFLPNWQIIAAPSPACPAFNQHALAAKVGQRHGAAFQFGKTEVRGKLADTRGRILLKGRVQPKFESTPIFVLTALLSKDLAREGLIAGANNVFPQH
jgi:hypothetical protein